MNLFESPGFLVNKLAHLMANELERKFRIHGITTSWWAVLALLWKQEGLPQVEIQQKLKVEAATITGIIKRMEQAELIERRNDPVDKRIQLVYLTQQGRDYESMLVPLAKQVNEIALSGFTDDEKIFFNRLLTRAFTNMVNH
jgi:DNA-binding MarR family transcriptional regulator